MVLSVLRLFAGGYVVSRLSVSRFVFERSSDESDIGSDVSK